eukprot:TRINITY_DN7385_c0_g1_i1.p1 TRINITY_DN7385_c0_g1~~TRINITY_DN7385_c0_g1_i1.p1  ORF type:complete len:566 (+),score=109.97 TRINITY_DN7385_c0_g1_i1:1635-3332(+)
MAATVPTTPIAGQKTGTSGLRKKVTVFQQPNYLNNWLQALFTTLKETDDKFLGSTLVVGGDGRYWNSEAVQIIIKIAFANGVKKLIVAQNGLLATPGVSAVIRARKAFGGIIMTASHNPGGPHHDWGIKYNASNGEPAPEKLTDIIFKHTQTIAEYHILSELPNVDLSAPGVQVFNDHEVEVISSSGIYLDLLRSIFDFDALKAFLNNPQFTFLLDAMWGAGGAAATALLEEFQLGDKGKHSLQHNVSKEDFGELHPDPNLTYAKHLVDVAFGSNAPVFAAAFDGDADRNMILGDHFFVTPSDSVAIIAQYATKAIPYFKTHGIQGLARSMPTATALDRVAAKLGVSVYEVPTGWKFFCNLMDAGKVSICGEESFGTGSNHIREKDGLWAIIAWLSILQYRFATDGKIVSVRQIVEEHWREYGRSLYCRYDYESIAGEGPNTMMSHLNSIVENNGLKGKSYTSGSSTYVVAHSDNFTYNDPVDGSVAAKQGIRIIFEDSSRIIFRLSGTGSEGATVRLYIERVQAPKDVDPTLDSKDACTELAAIALEISRLAEFTGKAAPDVVT